MSKNIDRPRRPLDNEERRQLRRIMVPTSIAALALATMLSGKVGGDSDRSAPKTADETTFCVPSVERRVVHIDPGVGVDGLIHEIEGSGDGEGDPCWSESQKIVEDAIGGTITPVGQDVVLPQKISPKHK